MLNKVQETLLVNVADTFTMRQYADLSAKTAVYPEVGSTSLTAVAYCALGLAGEAGEIALKVDNLSFIADKDKEAACLQIVAEAGDVLWYVPQLLRELGCGREFDEVTFAEYAQEVFDSSTDTLPDGSLAAVMHCALMLSGKAGNVANKVKKLFRDGDSQEKRLFIASEVTSCLRWLPQLLHHIADAPLGEVALANIIKLADRQNRGKLHGDGDNR